MIKEYDKIRLKSGEIARICEILEDEALYIAEVFQKSGDISVEHIAYSDIVSIFTETEKPLAKAV